MSRARILGLYQQLWDRYGPQGWWPVPSRADRAGFNEHGYHHGDFQEPRNPEDAFEIIMGAVLTQNTAWTNVEMALEKLHVSGIKLPQHVRDADMQHFAGLIRSSGYFNQKARKLKLIADRFAAPDGLQKENAPSRQDLLAIWGVGPETADSILLYAFHKPTFVIDAYTRRLLSRIGVIGGRESYERIQELFHAALPPEHELFNEYHALIVEHAKVHCRARPICAGCPVKRCASRATFAASARA